MVAYGPAEFQRPSLRLFAYMALGAAALGLGALSSVWISQRLTIAAPEVVGAKASTPIAVAAVAPQPASAANPYKGWFDPEFSGGSAQVFTASLPLAISTFQPAPSAPAAASPIPESAPPAPTQNTFPLGATPPLPPTRPVQAVQISPPAVTPAVVRHSARSETDALAAAAPADKRTFFEKLFGLANPSGPTLSHASPQGGLSSVERSAGGSWGRTQAYSFPHGGLSSVERSAAEPSGRTLAYSLPASGLFSISRSATAGLSSRYDRWTAVYDLAAHTVYLPDGTRLEAHSGLGDRLDDPNHVNERMRGATPPHLYELAAREQLFHGVPALRLNPVGGGDLFGRAGLLAHSYMLGPNGDSNGCVSFKDYDAFLRAFQNGEVKRLAVVARLG